MKYIDADALKERVHERTKRCNVGSVLEAAYMEVEALIDEAEAADVAPVVHGHNLAPLSMFECSVCGWSCGDTVPGDTETYNFCPNCGAEMDVLFRRS